MAKETAIPGQLAEMLDSPGHGLCSYHIARIYLQALQLESILVHIHFNYARLDIFVCNIIKT